MLTNVSEHFLEADSEQVKKTRLAECGAGTLGLLVAQLELHQVFFLRDGRMDLDQELEDEVDFALDEEAAQSGHREQLLRPCEGD